jgi:hypothetical protein
LSSFRQLVPLGCRGGESLVGDEQPRVVFVCDVLAHVDHRVCLKGMAQRWWRGDRAERIGCCPKNAAEAYAARMRADEGKGVFLAFLGALRCVISFARAR